MEENINNKGDVPPPGFYNPKYDIAHKGFDTERKLKRLINNPCVNHRSTDCNSASSAQKEKLGTGSKVRTHERNHVRAGGVAIYHNKENAVNILTSQVELTAMQSTSNATVAEDVGDICISVSYDEWTENSNRGWVENVELASGSRDADRKFVRCREGRLPA
ncbi:hypothetical protein PV328_007686 [Microctonus aethiopoides]|uniref:Uncharacterized protein n=1 Tax=Microctonus aethiopoides TaxID=144406 RepID=A0AA39F1I6_9HYME|nr:hypothetical protein PV328_007686 [Microctonus aethiopoides]